MGSAAYAAAARARGLGRPARSCQPGSLPHPHLPPGTDTLPQIEHIVVLMMENHSFDDHLGMLGRGDGLTLGTDGKPVNYNPDPAGGYVRSFHMPNTCGETDSGISQCWNASHTSWDNGTNMGFVKACSGAAMGYWDDGDLPFYHSHGSSVPDRRPLLRSVMAQTYPNRRFLIAGTALGNIRTDVSGISKVDAPNGTIFDRLNALRHLLEGLLPRPADLCALRARVPQQPDQGRAHDPVLRRRGLGQPARRSASSTPTPTSPRRTGTSRWARATPRCSSTR